MMAAGDVVEIMFRLQSAGIDAWLDGGWGIDALLGEETRDHEDLDIVLELGRFDEAAVALSWLGFSLTIDERPTRAVLQDESGRQIDVHTVTFDDAGGGVQVLPGARSYTYPAAGFAGRGMVGGEKLRCMSAAVQIECHLGYEPTAKDRRDVRLLAERFGLPLPKGYRSPDLP
jgi:lincosamide nucleotidyltransferase A/C/D/E